MVLPWIIDFILHIDVHLAALIALYPRTVYVLLFLIIFIETGLVVMPFLPGDSLLFAAGSFAALGSLNVFVLVTLLFIAAILGDTINYAIGSFIGPRAFCRSSSLFLNPEHLERARSFYERHGGKTIVFARFIPLIRTFAPFVAGIGRMRYSSFLAYNLAGGALWVALFVIGGYFFGTIPVVRDNFSFVILAIIVVSILPLLFSWMRSLFIREGPPHLSLHIR